jgi:nucleoside phosphorylase
VPRSVKQHRDGLLSGAIAERGIANFRPSVALFVRVAGGVKDVAIGDVVVADKMYGYESGKEDETGFRPRPEVKNAAHDIEQRGRTLPKTHDWKSLVEQRRCGNEK